MFYANKIKYIIFCFILSISNLTHAQTLQVWGGVKPCTLSVIKALFEEKTSDKLVIHTFDMDNIRAELLIAQEGRVIEPDIIWVPSDFLGLHRSFNLAAIPDNWIDQKHLEFQAKKISRVDHHYYGIPVELGNTLVLYVNKALTTNLSPSWETLIAAADKGKTQVAMQYPNMFFMSAFMSLFDSEFADFPVKLPIPSLVDTLHFYSSLTKNHVIAEHASQLQARVDFFSGKVPYLIDGDWSLDEAVRQFGNKLYISELPSYRNVKMQSLSGGNIIAFSKNSMNNAKKRASLKVIADIVRSKSFIQSTITTQHAISTNKILNQKALAQNKKNYKALYHSLLKSHIMPSTLKMAVVWEGFTRGYQRYQAGMPVNLVARFINQFVNENLIKIQDDHGKHH